MTKEELNAINDKIDKITVQLENKYLDSTTVDASVLRFLIKAHIDSANTILFYADPDSYRAILLLRDSPCGDFGDDMNVDMWTNINYDRSMPGKMARAWCYKYMNFGLEEVFDAEISAAQGES